MGMLHVCFAAALCAGKSTTFGILTGLIQADSGFARLAGHDCATELAQVYNSLGICPQFDLLWDGLSVYQHLVFYARVKGCPLDAEEALVQAIAEMVDLDGDAFHRPAGALSGGMKR